MTENEKRYKVNIDHHKTSRNYVTGILDCETNVLLDNHTAINNRLNEQHETIQEKQHTISEMAKVIRTYDDGYIGLNKRHLEYKQKVKETLQGHYDFARNKKSNCQKNDLICFHCYRVLKASIEEIADELGVELK